MEESFLHEKNPWIDDDMSFSALKQILYLAEKSGQIIKKRDLETQEILDNVKESSVSLKMIQILKAIEATRKEIDSINLEIQLHLQDRETKDITHISILEKRVQELNDLSGHLTHITEEKDHLINSLQQPYCGEYMKIEAKYKKYASALFPLIVPVLSDLSRQLDNITWTKSVDIMKNGRLDSILSEISSTLATLQSSFQSVCEMSSGVRNLHLQRTSFRTTLPS